MRWIKQLLMVGFAGWMSLITVVAIGAQPIAASCGELVRTALASAGEQCNSLERNQVCYGNLAGSITPRNLSMSLEWNQVGDVINLSDIAGLTLSPLNQANNEWGVAVMSVQASLPDTMPGQNVTMLMFGNVSVEDAATDPNAKPMQAIYFKTGLGETECAEAPSDGIMIQTPKGVGLVELTVNGVNVSLGSTALLTAPPVEGGGSRMRVTLLEGRGIVESKGVRRVVVPGSQTEVVFDESGEIASEPSDLSVYEAEDFEFYDTALEDLGIELPEIDEETFDDYLDSIPDEEWEDMLEDIEAESEAELEDAQEAPDQSEAEDINNSEDSEDEDSLEEVVPEQPENTDSQTEDGGGGGDDGGGGGDDGGGGGGDDGGGGGDDGGGGGGGDDGGGGGGDDGGGGGGDDGGG